MSEPREIAGNAPAAGPGGAISPGEPVALAYVGEELELFAHALNWKRYWSSLLRPYLQGEVLEAGAGLGANTCLLRDARQRRWVCLEPDPKLVEQLRLRLAGRDAGAPRAPCEARLGTTANLAPAEVFDAILYIDVLEHIEHDAEELRRAAAHLKPQGRLIVLSPAHGWLYSKFDAAIGHYRRYTKKSLSAAAPPELRRERLLYLDCAGLLASLGNRLLLKQDLPTLKQILFWDRTLVPVSRVLDPIFGYCLGKSVLGIWQKVGSAP